MPLQEKLSNTSHPVMGLTSVVRRSPIESALHKHTPMVAFSVDGIIKQVSPMFLAIVGYEEQEILGQHHRLLCHADDVNSEDYREFWSALAQGVRRTGTFRRLSRSGRDVWIEATYIPVASRFGSRIDSVIKIAYDVTEKQNAITAVRLKRLYNGNFPLITISYIEFRVSPT